MCKYVSHKIYIYDMYIFALHILSVGVYGILGYI